MDSSKLTAAITAARAELKKLTMATVEAGSKDVAQFKALPKLAKVDEALVKAEEKLADASASVAPKTKKEKTKK